MMYGTNMMGGAQQPNMYMTGMPNNLHQFGGIGQISGYAASQFGGPQISAPMQGPGPSIESFQKDGFKIMGKEPIKVKDQESQREFAELFSLADTKIKDRTHEKPRYDLTYKPPMNTPQEVPYTTYEAPLLNDESNY